MNTESIAAGKGVLMPPVNVDPAKIKTFDNAIAFHTWLSVHHHEEDAAFVEMLKRGETIHPQGKRSSTDS